MGKTILIVENDPDDLEFLKSGCEMIGSEEIHFFNKTPEAIEFLSSLDDTQLPALIVSDYDIRKSIGDDLLSFLKTEKRFSTIKTAVMLGGYSSAYIEKFRAIGVDEMFEKPFDMDDYKAICSKLKELAQKT